jgi:hypothetical protein
MRTVKKAVAVPATKLRISDFPQDFRSFEESLRGDCSKLNLLLRWGLGHLAGCQKLIFAGGLGISSALASRGASVAELLRPLFPPFCIREVWPDVEN